MQSVQMLDSSFLRCPIQRRCITVSSGLSDQIQERVKNIKDHKLETRKFSQILGCAI